MAVNRACYCTRQDVMSAPDIKQVQDYTRHVDSAIEAAAGEVDKLCNRRFWNGVETLKYDWPNYQRAVPWRIWFDAGELADVTALPPVVTTGGTSIPDSAIFFGPWNYAPPFTYMELDRSQSFSYGVGSTPQQDVKVTGLRGYWNQAEPGGALAAALSDTTSTAVTVTDSYTVGVGDVIIVGTESMQVRDMAWAATGLTLSSGGTADSAADVVLTLSGAGIVAGEVIQVDAEWMLAVSVAGSVVVVERGYNGSVIATHSAAAAVYAQRQLTVARGFGGSTAAAHLSNAAVTVQLIPADAHELAIAEALNIVFQKTAAYARTIGENGAVPVPGGGLQDLRDKVYNSLGRKARQRVV
jgi:hypothetical protein